MPNEIELRLYRDSLSTPWGFRLQGGKDLNAQLTVQKVNPGTPSDGELQSGDAILQIQGSDASRFTHLQAQDQIRKAGGSLLLRIVRYGAPLRAPLLLTQAIVTPVAKPSWKTQGIQDPGIDYSRQPGRIPHPVASVQPQPQPGFMLSRVKDTLSGVSGGYGGYGGGGGGGGGAYPFYPSYEPPTVYQPQPTHFSSRPPPPPVLEPEEPAWAGSLRSAGQVLNSDKSAGPYPHSPKVQTVHYAPGEAPQYRQNAPGAGHDTDTVRAAHLQYNSPLGLYSRASAQEAMHTQLHGRPGEGTIQIVSESEAGRLANPQDGQFESQAVNDGAEGIGQSDF